MPKIRALWAGSCEISRRGVFCFFHRRTQAGMSIRGGIAPKRSKFDLLILVRRRALALHAVLLLYKVTSGRAEILRAALSLGGSVMRKQAATRQSDVLKVLKTHDKPMTAYAILDLLKRAEPALAAPTVYRTLSALTEQGRAHRLESLKAFVPCRCDHEASVPVLAVCADCGVVEEHDGSKVLPHLNAISERSSFQASRHILEIHGLCQTCSA